MDFSLIRQKIEAGPYRLFFPVAILFGVLGVGYWIGWYSNAFRSLGSTFHHAGMIKGFMSWIIVGFLFTALPRFLGAESVLLGEVVGIMGLGVLSVLFASRNQLVAENIFFAIYLISVVVVLSRKWPRRTKTPPATFSLIAWGMLSGIVGALLTGVAFHQQDFGLMYAAGRGMLHLGFPLQIVLGVSGFLTPFLMGYTLDPQTPESPINWRQNKWFIKVIPILVASFITVSFCLDGTPGLYLRAFAVSAFLIAFARINRFPKTRVTYTLLFYFSCWMIVLGTWVSALFPRDPWMGMHLIFIGGFSVMIFSFGTLVLMSHAGKAIQLKESLWGLRLSGSFLFVALAFRVCASVFVEFYGTLILLASLSWILAAVMWAAWLAPLFWESPLMGKEHTSC
jgi:uncharacterized protein involved in response to NO